MPTDRDKAKALRERARVRFLREQEMMTKEQKLRLPEIQKRLARKTRSSLPVRERVTPPVPV
jgi:hypothetical protein